MALSGVRTCSFDREPLVCLRGMKLGEEKPLEMLCLSPLAAQLALSWQSRKSGEIGNRRKSLATLMR